VQRPQKKLQSGNEPEDYLDDEDGE
jgi:hypothetical protein